MAPFVIAGFHWQHYQVRYAVRQAALQCKAEVEKLKNVA